ncbi:hypothetical protein N8I77_002682 [Diaporthe amygdali]|uniref:Uncharacterized protein n=1 Tax=Phomopsis amygdali TaxID=1214568 RepID=A0AAD9WBJ7_PHOAM|nr:hypothetical protein N8I77_002682 [Diaporthe amygdali]
MSHRTSPRLDKYERQPFQSLDEKINSYVSSSAAVVVILVLLSIDRRTQCSSGETFFMMSRSQSTLNMATHSEPHLHDTRPVSETSVSGVPHPEATDVEQGPNRADPIRSKLTRTWLAALSIGALLLIAVPGVVVGVLTKQVAAGVGLSSVITEVIGTFAGVYYHHSSRG